MGKLIVTLRERTFHFAWCSRTETDRVCTTCGAIVPGTACQHCARIKDKKSERLRRFLEDRASRAQEN